MVSDIQFILILSYTSHVPFLAGSGYDFAEVIFANFMKSSVRHGAIRG